MIIEKIPISNIHIWFLIQSNFNQNLMKLNNPKGLYDEIQPISITPNKIK